MCGYLGDRAEEAIAVGREHLLRLSREWNLSVHSFLPGATCCVVAAGCDPEGHDVVLRIPLVEEEAGPGFAALRAFAGHRGVAVLREDPASGSTLLPRLQPGINLAQRGISDEEAVRVCTSVALELHKAPISGGWTLERWMLELFAEDASKPLVVDAQAIARQLLNSTTEKVLLHGDLHHFNLLLDSDHWVAIDPKGVIGDPAYEPVAFLRNPVPAIDQWPHLKEITARRIRQFSEEMKLPADRIWGWAFAQIVIDAVWAQDWNAGWRRVAVVLASLRPEFWPHR